MVIIEGMMPVGERKPERAAMMPFYQPPPLFFFNHFCSVNTSPKFPTELTSTTTVHSDLAFIELLNIYCMKLIRLLMIMRYPGMKKFLRLNSFLKRLKGRKKPFSHVGGLFCRAPTVGPSTL